MQIQSPSNNQDEKQMPEETGLAVKFNGNSAAYRRYGQGQRRSSEMLPRYIGMVLGKP